MTQPTQEDQRDLSFEPATKDGLKRLTAQQIDNYNEDGYLKGFNIFDDREVAQNRAYFDSLLDQLEKMNDGRDAYAINCYQTRCRGIYDLATDERILDYVEDLIGPNVICWATHFFCKLPHNPKTVPWHQDASYWQLTPSRTVTVWLAIDDADVENACMHVIPGTHRMGHLKWKHTQQDAVLGLEIMDVDRLGEPAPIELKAGQIELHADMLVHGSSPNQSDRRRCGLTLRYCPPHVRALTPAWASDSIIARGKDPSGQWANNPRPDGEDISLENGPTSIGGN